MDNIHHRDGYPSEVSIVGVRSNLDTGTVFMMDLDAFDEHPRWMDIRVHNGFPSVYMDSHLEYSSWISILNDIEPRYP